MNKDVSDHIAETRNHLNGVSSATQRDDLKEALRQIFYAVDSLADAVAALNK